jgi:glycosyltransferase involved in cell wall biosynthesis
MPPTPTISVLMPIDNAERYVTEEVECILIHSEADMEFLVVDDGSMDGSLRILQRFAERAARIRVSNRPNRGILESRNEFLVPARGEFVPIMDADDVTLPRRLSTQHNYMLTNPTWVGVGRWVQAIDEGGELLPLWSFPLSHDEIDEANLSSQRTIRHSAFFVRGAAAIGVGGDRKVRISTCSCDWPRSAASRTKLRSWSRIGDITYPSRALPDFLKSPRDDRRPQRRRGLAPATRARDGPAPVPRAAANHRWWASADVGASQRSTARKLAMTAIRQDPLAVESWRVVCCTLRGF